MTDDDRRKALIAEVDGYLDKIRKTHDRFAHRDYYAALGELVVELKRELEAVIAERDLARTMKKSIAAERDAIEAELQMVRENS